MSNINDAFPSNYLKASDIRGAEPVVTIDHVAFEPVGRQREMKAVLYFKGKDKGLVLNKTNATKITALVGSPETEQWDGCRIKLYATETEFSGETVECIRIKPAPALQAQTRPAAQPAPRQAPVARQAAPAAVLEPEPQPESEALTDDDIPFAWLLPWIAVGVAASGVLLA